MNARRLVQSSLGILLILVSFAAHARDTYVPIPNEELYGTWIKDETVVINSVAEQWQKTIIFAGGYKDYARKTDRDPSMEGILSIQSKWTDADGNTWYKSYGEITEGSYTGNMIEELTKLSKNATVKESVWFQVYTYDDRGYPTKIDPQNATYSISIRSE